MTSENDICHVLFRRVQNGPTAKLCYWSTHGVFKMTAYPGPRAEQIFLNSPDFIVGVYDKRSSLDELSTDILWFCESIQ